MARNLKSLVVVAAFVPIALWATGAQAAVYYSTTLTGTETVVGTVLFEEMGNGTITVSAPAGGASVTTPWNFETSGGTYGYPATLEPPAGLPGPLNPLDISGTTKFDDQDLISAPTNGFMLAVIADPGTSLETANGVPDATLPFSNLHLVMMVSDTFATTDAFGKAFGTGLTGGFSEDGLITDVLDDDEFYVLGSNIPAVESAVYDLASFASQNGAALSYSLPGTYDVVSFSNGTSDGTGAASFSQPLGVPEPATWAMLLLGFFGVGFMMRGARREDTVAVA